MSCNKIFGIKVERFLIQMERHRKSIYAFYGEVALQNENTIERVCFYRS